MKQYKPKYPNTSYWDKIISPITLTMKKGTWEIFKSLIPRNKKLNDAVVDLIHKIISENTEEATDKEIKQWIKDQEYYEKKEGKINDKKN